MEDERVIEYLFSGSKITLEMLLKVLYHGSAKLYGMAENRKLGDLKFDGETEWNKFMHSLDPITIQDLQNNDVNLDKFKKELEKYGIGFAFYKHHTGDKVSMAFAIKHKDLVEKALADTLEKIVNKDNVKDFKKTPADYTLTEKLKYYENLAKGKFNEREFVVEKEQTIQEYLNKETIEEAPEMYTTEERLAFYKELTTRLQTEYIREQAQGKVNNKVNPAVYTTKEKLDFYKKAQVITKKQFEREKSTSELLTKTAEKVLSKGEKSR